MQSVRKAFASFQLLNHYKMTWAITAFQRAPQSPPREPPYFIAYPVILIPSQRQKRGQASPPVPFLSRKKVRFWPGLRSHIHHVHIRAEAHVVGQVPADVIRIVIDHDVVGIPQPSVAEGNVKRRYVPVPAVEPEAAGASAAQMPHMPAAKSAGKAAMLEGVVKMIVRVAASRVVAHPALAFHVRNAGVSGLVAVVALGLGRMGCAGECLGAVGRNRLMPSSA